MHKYHLSKQLGQLGCWNNYCRETERQKCEHPALFWRIVGVIEFMVVFLEISVSGVAAFQVDVCIESLVVDNQCSRQKMV